MSVGRNDKCPCDSGLKYKKCCMNKQDIIPDEFIAKMCEKLRVEESVDCSVFLEYNNTELISILSYLQCLPQNHGKNIRLEDILRNAILSNSESLQKVNVTSLKDFIHAHFTHNHLEDPAENLFTQNICTPTGNFIVFPGVGEGTLFALQHLLNVISLGHFDSKFKRDCLSIAMALMHISNSIAESLNYQRNLKGIDTSDNDIYFPGIADVNTHKNLFVYDKETLYSILSLYNLNIDDISEFILSSNDPRLLSDDRNQSPIFVKPFVVKDGKYIILSLPNLVTTAIISILNYLSKIGKLNDIVKEYAENCNEYASFLLHKMGFKELDFSFSSSNLNIQEGIFRFDADKIAYVVTVYDDGENFDFNNPFSRSYNGIDDIEYKNRISEIEKQLKNKFSNNKLFHLNLILGLSRPIRLAMPNNTSFETLGISLNGLEILSLSNKCNHLTLWNYHQARKTIKLAHNNDIDNIAFFIDNDESFYHRDKLPHMLFVAIGNSINFKYDTIVKNDVKLCQLPTTGWVTTFRTDIPAIMPIYSTEQLLMTGAPFRTCTDVLGSYLWVNPANNYDIEHTECERFESEIVPYAIAYWFVILADTLRANTFILNNPLEIRINLKYDLDNVNFDDFIGIEQSVLIDGVEVAYDNNIITISLDSDYINLLDRADNLAERILMCKLLSTMMQYIWKCPNKSLLDSMIEADMPLSSCKRIVFRFSNFDIRTYCGNIIGQISQSRYMINKQSDGLAEIISADKPYVPKEISNDKKVSLTAKIVDYYYTKLRGILSQYNRSDVIKILYAYYESSIQSREAYKMMAIPDINCFKNEAINIKAKNIKNTDISISLKCLIEHLAAEGTKNTAKITKSVIDECNAYMHNIIKWGFIGDSVRFNISDIRLTLLESKRISISQDHIIDSLSPYFEAKQAEDLINLNTHFGKYLARPKFVQNTEDSTKFDEVFIAEFNISFDDYMDINSTLSLKAFKYHDSVICNSTEDIISDISTETGININTIHQYLKEFSLNDRIAVENINAPNLNKSDFYPWRYNRNLSLLRKPIIICKMGDIEYMIVGARSLVDSCHYLVSSIYDTRLKCNSKKMKSFISALNHEKGNDFTESMFNKIRRLLDDSIIIDKEVEISPDGKLKNDKDIGDIDLLIIDPKIKKIIAIECKNINVSRTPYEMHLEYMKFISGDKPWIPKVDKRMDWLRNNLEALNIYGINAVDYKLEYIFLTNEKIALPFIKAHEIQYRFLSSIEMQNNINTIFEDTSENIVKSH